MTPGQGAAETEKHLDILKAYTFARGISLDAYGTLHVEDEPTIKPTLPDLRGYPQEIVEAFAPVREAQARTPNIAMVSPLISIHTPLLPAA
ncbi:MAG: hypothetical protein HYV40_00545 [Candidatus Levybacteria bacterium]|nr:hypothetical protein [Candidatus Levybacteria bacterium]